MDTAGLAVSITVTERTKVPAVEEQPEKDLFISEALNCIFRYSFGDLSPLYLTRVHLSTSQNTKNTSFTT